MWTILSRLFGTFERPSSSDIVPRASIEYTEVGGKTEVKVDLSNINVPFTKPPRVWIPSIPDTNSMDPTCDQGHNNILISGADEENQRILCNFLKVGDVAVYRIPDKFYAIHRISRIGHDTSGRFFKFRGDNNPVEDPYKARDEHIKWLSMGTIY